MAELTDEQIAAEEEFMQGIPRLNIGALFLPPIWGPGHGIWATVLFYPIWLFADNMLYAAYAEQTALSVILASITLVSLIVGTVIFAILSQPFAAHRAVAKGVSKADYIKRERIWAVACVIVGCIMIAAATYYNLIIRPTLGG